MLGVKTLTTRALIANKTILIVGTILRTTPNAVQRHFETFCAASDRATRIADTDDILVLGSMRDSHIVPEVLSPYNWIL